MYPRSGFWYRGTSAKTTLLETTFCEPPKLKTNHLLFAPTALEVLSIQGYTRIFHIGVTDVLNHLKDEMHV